MNCFCQFLRKILWKMCKFQTFLKLWITFEIIDAFICFSTHFKDKFTWNVKNIPKNYTNFSLDSETGLNLEHRMRKNW